MVMPLGAGRVPGRWSYPCVVVMAPVGGHAPGCWPCVWEVTVALGEGRGPGQWSCHFSGGLVSCGTAEMGGSFTWVRKAELWVSKKPGIEGRKGPTTCDG